MSYVLFPGHATDWVDFVKGQNKSSPKAELEEYRALAEKLRGGTTGIRLIGIVGITSHYRDIAQLAKVPVIFATTPAAADIEVTKDAAERDARIENAKLTILAFKCPQKRGNLRAIVRVSNVVRNSAGDVIEAAIEHLESSNAGLTWARWEDGKRLCLNGFRIECRTTKRAGPHIRIGAVEEASPRDREGYRLTEARFLATVKIAGEGVLVLKPSDPIDPAYLLENGSLPEDGDELVTVRNALIHFYGTQDPDRLIMGGGDRYRGVQLEYGRRKAA